MLNRHFSIYLVAYILPAAVGFFAVTAYTRLLTPAEYGVYVVGISLAGILGAIFFAWIKLSVSRYQAMSAEVDFRGTAMVAFALTVAVLCATTPLVFLFRSDLSVGLLLASMFVAIMANASMSARSSSAQNCALTGSRRSPSCAACRASVSACSASGSAGVDWDCSPHSAWVRSPGSS